MAGPFVTMLLTVTTVRVSSPNMISVHVTLFPLLEKLYSLYIRLSLICQNKLSRNNKLYYKLCAIYILYSENRKKNIKKLYTVGLREIGGSLIHKMENISQIWIMDQ